jgi:hypothetical protein
MWYRLHDGPPRPGTATGSTATATAKRNIYKPADAIPSAANCLRAVLRNADGNRSRAVFGHNHSQDYVDDVLARARTDATARRA